MAMKRLGNHRKTGRAARTARSRVPSRSESREQLAELIDQRSAISEVLRTTASSPHDLQPILETIVDNAIRLCRGKVGVLLLFEEKNYRVVARRGYLHPLFKLPGGFVAPVRPGTPLARLVESKSSVHIADLAADPAYLRRDPILVTLVEGVGIRTCLLVPMLKEDELIGAIVVNREQVQPYTDNQIALVTAFAAQAAIALEITRREQQIRELQMELAHANRVATIGQLSASIAHEVKQPIAVAVTGAQAARRWLNMQPANLAEVDDQLLRIVREGQRAGEVVDRLSALIKKTPARKERLDINQAIREVSELAHGEAVKNCVSVQTDLADDLPLIECDRVQLQQVIMNLIVNAIQAMRGFDSDRRELHISTDTVGAEGVRVVVQDNGPGLTPESLPRLFEPFYTTKADGMGMGLAICRSIIEAHEGRLWATAREPHGALFQFTIPAEPETTS